jgi:hypothetical protein
VNYIPVSQQKQFIFNLFYLPSNLSNSQATSTNPNTTTIIIMPAPPGLHHPQHGDAALSPAAVWQQKPEGFPHRFYCLFFLCRATVSRSDHWRHNSRPPHPWLLSFFRSRGQQKPPHNHAAPGRIKGYRCHNPRIESYPTIQQGSE